MPSYYFYCGICGYTTDYKSSMDRHKARKRPCTVRDRTKHNTPAPVEPKKEDSTIDGR